MIQKNVAEIDTRAGFDFTNIIRRFSAKPFKSYLWFTKQVWNDKNYNLNFFHTIWLKSFHFWFSWEILSNFGTWIKAHFDLPWTLKTDTEVDKIVPEIMQKCHFVSPTLQLNFHCRIDADTTNNSPNWDSNGTLMLAK